MTAKVAEWVAVNYGLFAIFEDKGLEADIGSSMNLAIQDRRMRLDEDTVHRLNFININNDLRHS